MASTLEISSARRIVQEGTFEQLENLINNAGVVSVLPILVQFKKPIFDDDFVETGMKAELVAVEFGRAEGVPPRADLKIYFYFSDELYTHNKKFFKRSYFGRPSLGQQRDKLFTAEEVGEYTQQYSVYVEPDARISEYLTLVADQHGN